MTEGKHSVIFKAVLNSFHNLTVSANGELTLQFDLLKVKAIESIRTLLLITGERRTSVR